MAFKFTNKKGKIRFYDATGTPYYLEIPFDAGDLAGPTGRNLPELISVLDKGVKDENSHYITGTEECYLEGLDLSLSLLVTDLAAFGYAREWIKVLNGDASAVNSISVVTTKGTTQNDGANNNPAFPDGRSAMNVEFLLDGPVTDAGYKFAEVFFPYPKFSSAEDSVPLALAGKIYGTIEEITAFTAGTDITV